MGFEPMIVQDLQSCPLSQTWVLTHVRRKQILQSCLASTAVGLEPTFHVLVLEWHAPNSVQLSYTVKNWLPRLESN